MSGNASNEEKSESPPGENSISILPPLDEATPSAHPPSRTNPDILSASLGTMSPLLSNRSFSQRERSMSWAHLSAPSLMSSSPSSSTKSIWSGPFAPPSMTKNATETVIQRERQRRLEMERKESTLAADELRVVLREERIRMSRMAADLATLKSAAVASQVEAEVNEEGRINSLMRRLEGLQQEKGRIMAELEEEEQIVHITLQKKLVEVRKEKNLLEQQILREESSQSALQTRLTRLRGGVPDPVEEGEDEEECTDEDLVDLAAEAERRQQAESSV